MRRIERKEKDVNKKNGRRQGRKAVCINRISKEIDTINYLEKNVFLENYRLLYKIRQEAYNRSYV